MTIPRSGSGWPNCWPRSRTSDARFVSDGRGGVRVRAATPIDAAVVDYQLGGRSGLWCSRKLKSLPDPPAVLIYSAFSDHLLAAASVAAGPTASCPRRRSAPSCATRSAVAAHGESRLPLVPPAVADSLRHRLDPTEQAIYGMMSARIADPEIAATLGLTTEELEARSWTMLRKLERIDASRS